MVYRYTNPKASFCIFSPLEVAVAVQGEVLGLAALRDTLQPECAEVIRSLQLAGEEVWMCTGDHEVTARAVAEELGIPMKNAAHLHSSFKRIIPYIDI